MSHSVQHYLQKIIISGDIHCLRFFYFYKKLCWKLDEPQDTFGKILEIRKKEKLFIYSNGFNACEDCVYRKYNKDGGHFNRARLYTLYSIKEFYYKIIQLGEREREYGSNCGLTLP